MKTKCNFKELVVLVALLFSALFSNMKAQNGVCGDNLTWSFNSETGELTITGTGEMENYSDSNSQPWIDIAKDVKRVVVADGVLSLGRNAFNNFINLESIKFSNTIKEIGQTAFSNCTKLQEVDLPQSLNKLDLYVFNECTSLKECIIPNSVTQIKAGAFYYCI